MLEHPKSLHYLLAFVMMDLKKKPFPTYDTIRQAANILKEIMILIYDNLHFSIFLSSFLFVAKMSNENIIKHTKQKKTILKLTNNKLI